MARDFNQNRIANARLVSTTIDKFGKTFAIQSPWNADGFSNVNVTVEQAPSNIKQYLEGDNSITIYPVASNIDRLCEYALASFPNIVDIYLFKTNSIVVLDDDLSYLLDLTKIYVPSDLLSAYQSAYPTLSSKFDTIVEDYTLTIPFIGDTTLTSEYVDSVIAMLSNAEKNAITKIVIPTDFSEESADAIAWGYDFSALVNLNNNIWYGATQYDFTTITIRGSGTLTSAIVESSIDIVPSSKLSGVTKVVVPVDFTSIENNALSIIGYYPDITSLSILMNNNYYLSILNNIINAPTRSQILEFETSINITFGRNEGNDFFDLFPNCEKYIINGYFQSGTFGATSVGNNKVKEFLTTNNSKIIGKFDRFMNSLTNLETFGAFDMSEYVSSFYDYSFKNCSKLSSILAYGWIVNFNIADTMLDHDALVVLLNNLGTPETQKTLTMGATKLALLSAEEIAIATAKGWTIQ